VGADLVDELVPAARAFLLAFFKARPGPQHPSDIDELLIGRLDVGALLHAGPQRTCFTVAIRRMMEDGQLRFYRDDAGRACYELTALGAR
jgi:hypothetical protein